MCPKLMAAFTWNFYPKVDVSRTTPAALRASFTICSNLRRVLQAETADQMILQLGWFCTLM